MADPFADPGDVAVLLQRDLSDTEEAKVEALIRRASALLRAEFPDIDGQIDTGALDADVVADVAADMAYVAMSVSATGVSQESQTVGPYSHSQSYANPLGKVFLTEAQRTLILGYRPAAKSVRYAC